METLRQQLDELLNRLDQAQAAEIRSRLQELVSVYPFNEFEYIISHLFAGGKFTIDEYYEIRNNYIDRNLYLPLFEISAPRGFGELWAQGHLKEFAPTAQRPNKKLDPEYSGQYDFFIPPSIRIEVKASRAVEFHKDEPLYIKALSSQSNKMFDMNFQQIKPRYCDVFIWIAAWRDVIKYWVIPSYEIETNRYYSKGQHRGNVGEGQLHFNRDNIHEFDKYLVKPTDLEQAIKEAYAQEKKLRGAS